MKIKKVSFLITALLVILALPALAAPDMIPCEIGNKWEYDSVKVVHGTLRHNGMPIAKLNDASSGVCTYEVISAKESDKGKLCEYKEIAEMKSVNGAKDSTTTRINLLKDDAEVRIVSTLSENSNSNEPDEQVYDPPLFYYAGDAAPGKSWQVGEMRDGDTITFVEAKAECRETVTVPAGTFKNCLKIVYSSDKISGTAEMWSKKFTVTSGGTRGIYWIADGVGVVKEFEVAVSTAETEGPDGNPVVLDAVSCTVSELKPGYVAK